MSSLNVATSADQLAAQLQHPDADIIWRRALEVFGDESKARDWMATRRDIFAGRSPQELALGDASEQRQVLEVLLRIDFGVFS